MARGGPPKIMKIGGYIEECCVGQAIVPVVMGLHPTKFNEIRRTVGPAIEPAAAFQAAGVCVQPRGRKGFPEGLSTVQPPFQPAGVWANRAPA